MSDDDGRWSFVVCVEASALQTQQLSDIWWLGRLTTFVIWIISVSYMSKVQEAWCHHYEGAASSHTGFISSTTGCDLENPTQNFKSLLYVVPPPPQRPILCQEKPRMRTRATIQTPVDGFIIIYRQHEQWANQDSEENLVNMDVNWQLRTFDNSFEGLLKFEQNAANSVYFNSSTTLPMRLWQHEIRDNNTGTLIKHLLYFVLTEERCAFSRSLWKQKASPDVTFYQEQTARWQIKDVVWKVSHAHEKQSQPELRGDKRSDIRFVKCEFVHFAMLEPEPEV